VPVRELLPVLLASVYVNQDVPVPELAPGNVIQDASFVADQEQPVPVVMNALLDTLP
jgi:hypothetical protein